MINIQYADLESYIRASKIFQADNKLICIDLYDFTNEHIPDTADPSDYFCDSIHPLDNLNKSIGEFLAQELKPYFSTSLASSGTSSYFKCAK